MSQQDPGSVRTFFIFMDLPVHVEFRAGGLPLVPEGTVIDFDLTLRSPKDPRRTRRVQGRYEVSKRKLVYEASGMKQGLNQYLEFRPAVL